MSSDESWQPDYDVVVAGGGAAGVGAAIGAALTGAKVCLVEKYGFLGGAATNAQVLAYCGFFQRAPEPVQAVAGAGELVLDELRRHGLDAKPYRSPTTGNWIILLDPEVLKLSLDRICAEHGIDVLLHTRVASVSRTGHHLESVMLAGMDGRRRVIADAFVDASGDANLALLAGVDCQTGDENGHLQAVTMPLRIGGLAPGTRIDRQVIIATTEKYNETSDLKINRSDGGIYTRVPGSDDFWWLTVDLPIDDLSSSSFTRAEQQGRVMAHGLVRALRDHVDGFEDAYLAQTGPQIGIRESRHPKARYRMTFDDVVSGRKCDHPVARAAWPIELHGEAGKPIYHSVGGDGYCHVPLDAITADGLDNLWYAGRTIGADGRAYGSIRVMGTAFATGEAAGTAAALSASSAKPASAQAVNKALAARGALL